MSSVRSTTRLLAALFATALLLPPSQAVAQHAVTLTGQAPRSITAIRFRFIADGPIRGGFGLADGRLLFGTEMGTIYALDARDGRMLWRRSVGSPVLSTPALLGGRAYFTTWDNRLHAIDAATGRERWRQDLGRTLGPNDYWEYYVSSPIISGGRLYVGSGSGRMFAIDRASGQIAWSADLRARVRTTPVVLPDKVIVGTMMGHVVALDRTTGRQLWRFATQGAAQDFAFKKNDTRSVVTEPIVVGNVVIAGGRDGNIYGIDSASGRERWRETHDGGSWILGFAGDASRFYSGSGSAFVMQAADPTTGNEIWRTPTANAMFGGVARAGDVLVSNGINGSLFGFDTRSGAQLWQFRLPDMSLSSPLVASGMVFTGADDGSVFALDTSAAVAPKLDRVVYSYTNAPAASYFWFRRDVIEGVNAAFSNSGYKRVGSDELVSALESGRSGDERKVVVLADTRLPAAVDAAALRRYLDDGGVLVLIGPNPAATDFDKDGVPIDQDYARAASALGLAAPDLERDNGYNVSRFTPAARNLGLSGVFDANRWARPDQVTTVLATDRSAMATAWSKSYRNGGLLINLPIPRNGTVELTRYVNAVGLLASRL